MKCLVVDGISNGSALMQALWSRGATCFHVVTAPTRSVVERGIVPLPDDAWVEASFEYDDGDFDDLVAWVSAHGVECVVAGSEPGVELADALADALGLPGNSVRLSEARRNKALMGEALAAGGVPTPGGLCTGDGDAALRYWRDDLGGAAAVVKPLRSTGGDGVFFCRDEAAVRAATDEILGSDDFFGDANHELLIQRELTGRLFEVCTVSHAGRHEVVLMVETTKEGPIFDAMRLLTTDEVAERQLAVDVAIQALNALEIHYGAAHVEVLMTPDGPVVIEVAARLIGFLSPKLSRDALGTDQVTRLVDVLLDPETIANPIENPTVTPEIEPENHRYARAVALRSDVEGTIGDGIREVEARLMALPSVCDAHFRAVHGAHLTVTRDLPTAPGALDLLHEDPQQVADDHAAIRAMERDGLWRLALE